MLGNAVRIKLANGARNRLVKPSVIFVFDVMVSVMLCRLTKFRLYRAFYGA